MGGILSCCEESKPTPNSRLSGNKDENKESENQGSSSASLNSESESANDLTCECPVLQIPLAGNAFITKANPDQDEVITNDGLGNWMNEDAICSVYFHLSDPGEFHLSLRLSVPGGDKSEIKVSLGCTDSDVQTGSVKIKGSKLHDVPIGRFNSCSNGYVRLDLQGVSKSGDYFADVSDIIVTATSCKKMSCVAQDFDFHFGRRGPSIHLKYQSHDINLASGDSGIEYFYNEVTVPEGQDTIGSYFCAIAFGSGYFGIQVNSANERRVLFSIWSKYCTDDPCQIPEDFTVKLIRKGRDVFVGEFGGEGSGGQSFLRYFWKAGMTYKFLVRGVPIDANHSEFTGWFFSPTDGNWKLIASFVQPKTSNYLCSIYSFCENFSPETGHVGRMALYGNQWARDVAGNWHEITLAKYTGDETSKRSRFDFAGGVSNGQFFLKNCGFFNEKVETNQVLTRGPKGEVPQIEFSELQ